MGRIQWKGELEEEEGLEEMVRGQIFQAEDKDSPEGKVREKPLEV